MEYELVRDDRFYNITFTIKEADGTVVDLTDVATIKLYLAAVGGTTLKVDGACVRSSPYTAGICTYTVQTSDMDTVGIYHAEVELTYSGGKILTTERFDIRVVEDLP